MCVDGIYTKETKIFSINFMKKSKIHDHRNLLYTMLQKLSNCEVKAAQCLPLRFYVKSNFGDFKHSKNVIFGTFGGSEFWFDKFKPFLKSKIYQNSKLRVSENIKIAIFEIQILPKLFSRKIEWQINSCIGNLNFTFQCFCSIVLYYTIFYTWISLYFRCECWNLPNHGLQWKYSWVSSFPLWVLLATWLSS